MSLYYNYKLKEKTINVKIPIETDYELRGIILYVPIHINIVKNDSS